MKNVYFSLMLMLGFACFSQFKIRVKPENRSTIESGTYGNERKKIPLALLIGYSFLNQHIDAGLSVFMIEHLERKLQTFRNGTKYEPHRLTELVLSSEFSIKNEIRDLIR